MWLAKLEDEIVGCVVLRNMLSVPCAAECKRLYVRPAARGRHVATLLLDALEEHARNLKNQWIYLDTYNDLKPAIALYEQRGYERCDRYNDNPQATLFMRKRLSSLPPSP
jgi:ribosomal protein S18 acetylase RimI-like enzyme